MLKPEGLEDQVRRVVARHLGIPARMLAPGLSLRDDLGGDRHSIQELVLAVESRLGFRLEERILDEVRSYGELVTAALAAMRARRTQLLEAGEDLVTGRVRIIGERGRIVERAGRLTPYLLEAVCDDARRAGAGASLVVAVSEGATDAQMARLRERLAIAERLGVTVQVVRRADGSSVRKSS